jgi:xanthine permease XanP
MRQPPNIVIGVDQRPPFPDLVLLGLQYAFLLCVYLVIVVIIVRAAGAGPDVQRSAVSMAMIAMAVGTLLQSLHRGPIGSGFMAPPVYSAIYLGPSILAAKAGGLPAVLGMTLVAGLTELFLGMVLHRLRIVMQPTISGLTISVIGFQLGIVGMEQALDISSTPDGKLAAHTLVAMITLATCIGLTIWGQGVWRLVCSLLGMIAGVVSALAFGLFAEDAFRQLAAQPWFDLPDPSYVSFAFEPGLLPAFLAAGFAAMLRTVAVMGAPGMNIAPSLVGVSIATGVTSRAVAHACAVVLVVLAFVPKVADAFIQLPIAVAGALLVFTASIMLASGLQLMLSRPLNTRTTFVVSIGLLLPLTRLVAPAFFDRLPPAVGVFANNPLALSLLAAIGLLLVFRIATGRRQLILWQKSADAVKELRATLDRNAAEWGLTKAAIERAVTNTEQAIELIKEEGLLSEPLSIVAAERDNALEIELRYKGQPLFMPHLDAAGADAHEETSMAAGLHHVASGVYPDRSATIARGPETTIRLSFDM